MTTAYADEPFFATMHGKPLLGRAFGAGAPADGRVVVLSEAAWRQRFGARRDIVGQQIPLGEGGATVIGVMPSAFRFPEWAEAWMPLAVVPPGMQRMLRQRGNHADSRVVARLRNGVTPSQANARMNAIAARLAQAYPEESKQFTRVALVPMSEYITSFTNAGSGESLVPRIALVAGAAALLLLLGSANVAVLTLGDVRHYGQETDAPEEVYVPYTWDLWQWGASSSDHRAIRVKCRSRFAARCSRWIPTCQSAAHKVQHRSGNA